MEFLHSSLIPIYLCILIAVLTAIWFLKRKQQNLPPGPRGFPIVGSLFSLSKEQPFIDLQQLAKKYNGRGKIVRIKLGSVNVVVLNSFEAIKEALIKSGDTFSDRPRMFLFFQKYKGITGAPYSQAWKEQRLFALKTLRSLGMGKRSLEGKISTEISFVFNEIAKYENQPFDIHNIFLYSVANIICSILNGHRFDYEDPPFKLIIQHIKDSALLAGAAATFNFFPILSKFPFLSSFKEIRRSFSSFHNFFLTIIKKHKKDYQKDNIRDFIDFYLSEVEKIKDLQFSSFQDEEQLLMTVTDLFLAGTETTSVTLCWTILYLVLYPDIQEQIYKEIDSVVGRGRSPSLEDETRLVFTRATIREVQRIASVVPLGLPHVSIKDTTLMGYDIPKGTQIITNIWGVHNDDSVWEDPFVFKPSRFVDASGNLIRPNEYIPFSIGKRVCLGEQLAEMELFLFLTRLVQRYIFKLPEGTSRPSLKPQNGITLSPSAFKIIAMER